MRALVFAALVFCAACASAAPPAPAQVEDTCGIARFSHMIGAYADDIDRAALPPRTRIIGPNQAVTMDYSAERLNVMTDESGRVTELRCF